MSPRSRLGLGCIVIRYGFHVLNRCEIHLTALVYQPHVPARTYTSWSESTPSSAIKPRQAYLANLAFNLPKFGRTTLPHTLLMSFPAHGYSLGTQRIVGSSRLHLLALPTGCVKLRETCPSRLRLLSLAHSISAFRSAPTRRKKGNSVCILFTCRGSKTCADQVAIDRYS